MAINLTNEFDEARAGLTMTGVASPFAEAASPTDLNTAVPGVDVGDTFTP